MRNTADVTGGKLIAVWSQSISVAIAINPLVAFYDIHGGKRELLFFYFVTDTTRDQWLLQNAKMRNIFSINPFNLETLNNLDNLIKILIKIYLSNIPMFNLTE
jgi:hypothetical protein